MTAPFLSYHAAMAGVANMVAAISPTETSLLICRLHRISAIERLTNLLQLISSGETASIIFTLSTMHASVDLCQTRSRIRQPVTALGHFKNTVTVHSIALRLRRLSALGSRLRSLWSGWSECQHAVRDPDSYLPLRDSEHKYASVEILPDIVPIELHQAAISKVVRLLDRGWYR